MNRLIVFGAGGHGRVVADAARCTRQWDEIHFADDRHLSIPDAGALPIVGSFEQMFLAIGNYHAAALGLGNNARRLSVANTLREMGVALPAVVHPDATIATQAEIQDGAVILARAVIQPGARIGFAAIINSAAVVEHDCVIGDSAHISPGACLGGEVHVGPGAWIGIGAAVINLVIIGKGAIVGAGAAVTTNVPDGVTVVGVPAKVIRPE